ncbi:MAG TPA: nuclear transport factor 2 family protein [Solirubrobacterales bacterium]|nr:nuclear transport factor 2 family protein [Solirubrobacterales bacterium]
MAIDKVETVRQILAANRSGTDEETLGVMLESAGPNIEFHSRVSAIEGSDYRGHPGVREYISDMRDAFREWRNEASEIAEVSPNSVLAEITFHGIGKESGMEVQLRSAILFEFSGDQVVRCLSYPTREEALRAAGIEP